MTDIEIIDEMKNVIAVRDLLPLAVLRVALAGYLARLVFAGEWRTSVSGAVQVYCEADFGNFIRCGTNMVGGLPKCWHPTVDTAFRLAAEALQ